MKKKQHGFSLLEVACLVAIMGIVGLAAIPSIHQVRKQETEQFIREICLDLSAQRINARAGSTPRYLLELTPVSGIHTGYEITGPDTDITRGGARGFEVTITASDGSVTGESVEQLVFQGGKIMSVDGSKKYTTLIVEVKDDTITRKATFDADTGHYEINS